MSFPHSSRAAGEFLDKHLPDFLGERGMPKTWFPDSPGLTPVTNFLWDVIYGEYLSLLQANIVEKNITTEKKIIDFKTLINV